MTALALVVGLLAVAYAIDGVAGKLGQLAEELNRIQRWGTGRSVQPEHEDPYLKTQRPEKP